MATEPAARPTPALKRERQLAMYRRALETLPGGTDSNFRAWGEDTIYVDRGKGGRIWDLDGNEYVDLRMGYGPVILGHGDERVDDYVNERMRRGVSFSLTSEDEVQAGELIKELTGWVEKVRMTVSGTEATMHAMRVARGYTGRSKIVKFEGQYHGVHDYALISVLPNDLTELGDRDNPVRLAWGRGIPEQITQTVIPVPYNDLETSPPCLRARGRRHRRGDHRAGPRQRPGHPPARGLPPGRPGVSRRSSARCSSSTRSRPGSDSPAAAPPSTSGSRRTSARSPRRWATATRPPRSAGRPRS